MSEETIVTISQEELMGLRSQLEVEAEKNAVSQNFINNLTKENISLAGAVGVLQKRLKKVLGIEEVIKSVNEEASETIKDDQVDADSISV